MNTVHLFVISQLYQIHQISLNLVRIKKIRNNNRKGKRMFKGVLYKILLTLLCTILEIIVFAQDPQFTQFYANKLYLAPSFAGATRENRISMIYRNQWSGIPGAFNTMAFSYDHNFSNFNSGLGILILRDVAGSGKLGMTSIGLSYSYDIVIKNTWHIRPGLNFTYSMYGIDFAKLVFVDQLLSGSPTSFEDYPFRENTGALDASSSLLAYADKFWMGFNVDHLLKPNEAFYTIASRVPIRYSFFGGYQVVRKTKLFKPINEGLSIAYIYRQQADKKQLDLGVYWLNSPIMMGFWYRGIPIMNGNRGDAVAVLLGIKLSNFRVGYSYDFTISNLINSTHGSHEISVNYEFQLKKKKKIGAMPCPEL
jgi:type IX secretion system PorP/SprF family membrane protein